MGYWNIPISIILFYAALFLFANLWFEEILSFKFYCQLYLTITYTAMLWCFHLGNKSYIICYSTNKDEAGVKRYIEFPVIWM
jgi:hypothetical protein